MKDKRNQHIRDFCEDHTHWLVTRKFFTARTPMNILAQMQPSKNGREPDALLSPVHAAFHLSMMLWLDRDIKTYTCFLNVYFPKGRGKPLKTIAYDLGMHIDTLIEHAHKAAESIYWQAEATVKINEMMN